MLFLLLACSSGTGTDTADEALTWYRDVKPIVDRSCVSCHQEGGIAPFALDSYEAVSVLSSAVTSAVASRQMPPWGADSSVQDYLDDRSLPQEEIDAILDWVDAGMPEGDPADATEVAAEELPSLSRVDATIGMAGAYAPDFSTSPDEYRCFLIDWPLAEEAYVTGIDVHPGNDSIVHHVIAFLATPETVGTYAALDDADPGDGYACYGGPGGDTQAAWLGGWVPGKEASVMPEDTGIAVSPGSQVILQVHYNDSGEEGASAKTDLDLQVEEDVVYPAGIQPFTNPDWVDSGKMVIPAGAEGVSVTHTLSIPVDLRLYSGGMHMHTLGQSGRLWVERATGEVEWLVSVPSWDFSWQQSYWLQEPIDFNAGDKLGVECVYDNPGDGAVSWGEGTTDEMCLGLIYMAAR